MYGSSTGMFGPAGLSGAGIDRGEAVAQVVRHVQRAHVIGGHDVLRVEPGLVGPDHPVGRRVDDGHRGTAAVRHVDPVRHPADGRAEHVRPGVGVDVRRVRPPEASPVAATDRSATGLATCQVSADGGRTDRRGGRRTRVGRPGRRGYRGVRLGRKIITPTAIAATTATDTPPNHIMRRARWPAGQPTLPMPILPARPSRAALVPSWCLRSPRSTPEISYPLPGLAGDYTQAKAETTARSALNCPV